MLTVNVEFRRYNVSVRKTKTRRTALLKKAVMVGARAGAAFARSNHPHKRRSGRLTGRSTLYAVLDMAQPGSAKASFVNTTPYARFVEYPTRPHVIRPKAGHGLIGPLLRGQSRRAVDDIGTHRVALRFKIGGKTIFRAKVMHPGTPGFPFMRPALRPAAEATEQTIRIGWRAIGQDVWT